MWGRQGKAGAQERLVPKLCETFSGRKRLTEVPFYPPVEFKFTDGAGRESRDWQAGDDAMEDFSLPILPSAAPPPTATVT